VVRWARSVATVGLEQHDNEENASDDEPMDINEVPNPRNANGVPVTGRAN